MQIAFLEGSKAEIDALPIMTKRLTVTGSTLRPRSDEDKGEIARALAERVLPLMEQGQCLPRIHQVFPLAEAAGARADGKQPPHRQDHAAGAAMSAGTHAAPASATSGAARFAGQTAIVTGAVGGIGSAIVEGLLAEGARVGLIDFNGLAGDAWAGQLRGQGRAVCFAQADVSRYEECEAAYARISDELGPATILINNVGISPKTEGARSRSGKCRPPSGTAWCR